MKKEIGVSLEQEGTRLDVFIAPLFHSRSQAEKAIKKSLVYRALITKPSLTPITKPSHKVTAGESYYVLRPEKQRNLHSATPQMDPKLDYYDVSIPILFEDAHLLVINKPAGLPVHPGPGHAHDTLVNALIHKIPLSSGVDPLRPGVVHRLDKDVSGLMILSKTKKAEGLLIEQFKGKQIHRVYRALTVGKMPERAFSILSFIGRHPKDRKKFHAYKSAVAGAKKASTYCQVIQSFQDKIHLIECHLGTGRTHQIRVHLQSQGLPILRDPIYFPVRRQKQALKSLNLKAELFSSWTGIALYSAELQFSHPMDPHKTLHFKLPWPKDFHPLLKALHFPQGGSYPHFKGYLT